MNEAYKAAKEHKTKLINDQARLNEKLKTINEDVTKFYVEKEEANAAINRCEQQFIRDEVTVSQLETIRAAYKDSIDKLAAAEHLHQLVIDELQKIEREILKAQENIISSSKRFAITEKDSLLLAINKDVKFRQKVLEAYSANLVATNHSSLSWPHFLSSVFMSTAIEF